MKTKFLFLTALVLVCGCSKGEQQDNETPNNNKKVKLEGSAYLFINSVPDVGYDLELTLLKKR
ncbi:hypothetical protein FACS1894156_9060 [Bacteroidia bacterium]|nr:hypothetical protein FACS1894156_9060 [Bacteroidia bacterium]